MIKKNLFFKKGVMILLAASLLSVMPKINVLADVDTAISDIDESNILEASTYDENCSGLTYKGNWKTANSSKYEGGSIKYCTEAGSSVEFSFEGCGFEWYGIKGNVRGGADIYIDDELVTTVCCYNYPTEYRELLYRSSELEYGTHTVKIVSSEYSTGTSSYHDIDIDKIVILDDMDSRVLLENEYDESYNGIYYVNNWVSATSDDYDGKKIKVSRSKGSYAEFTFKGTAFEWYGTKANVRGKANIYIDDKLVTKSKDSEEALDIDCYAYPTQYSDLIYRSERLPRGTHKVRIVSTGEKNEKSTASDIDIDKIRILSNFNSTILSPGTYQNTNNAFLYYGNWAKVDSNNYDNKSIKVARGINDCCEFSFKGSSFEWHGTKATIRGCARITIDDIEIPYLVDCYNPITLYNTLLYKSPKLKYGVHTVKISVSGLKNDAASCIDIDLDKVVINHQET